MDKEAWKRSRTKIGEGMMMSINLWEDFVRTIFDSPQVVEVSLIVKKDDGSVFETRLYKK